jgi:AAA15 family ATPase/GTPase
MLIEFRVENHRSVRDEQVLTMEAGHLGEEDDSRPRRVPGHEQRLLPIAALYGANASGKSNILAALAFMCDAVLLSHRAWPPDEGVPRDPYAWGSKRSDPSFFEVNFIHDGVRYEYGFVACDTSFLEEWLYAWPGRKKQVWFERDKMEFKFGPNLKGENKLVQEVTRDNALFLSSAAQHRHAQLSGIYSWFGAIRTPDLPSARQPSLRERATEVWLAEQLLQDAAINPQQGMLFPTDEVEDPTLRRFRALLRSADVGIVDLRVTKGVPGGSPRAARSRKVQIDLRHNYASDDSWLPLEEQSKGTLTLFRLALPMLQTLEEGGILVVDELEASLHPVLGQHIVGQFNDPESNPKNAQLLFTTHDTNLLGTTLADGKPALRRDQVWLTEKNNEGATELYPLTDYKPRKAENIERGYLQGRFGAIPYLGSLHLARELAAAGGE